MFLAFQNKRFLSISIAFTILGIAYLLFLFPKSGGSSKSTTIETEISKESSAIPKNDQNKSTPKSILNPEVPEYVFQVLNHIQKFQEAPPNYIGGRIFKNREKKLKSVDALGTKIIYREWDVHPKIEGVNRGAERLITGSDHVAYFTKDHYNSFIKINL